MSKSIQRIAFAFAALLLTAPLGVAQDEGKDHPLIKRYPGSGVFGGISRQV